MKKLFTKFFAVMAMAIGTAVSVFGQNGFSYQAVIRDAEGVLVTNKQVEVRFSLKHDGTVYYSEKQEVRTNEYGNIQVVVGGGERLDGDFASVPWSAMDIRMEVAVDIDGKGEVVLGEVPVQGAPYAMYAQKAGGLTSKNASTKDGEALFSVNDASGNPVFAVFADGIVVYVDDTDTKAKRSGFVVTGRSATKGESATDYFSVTAEGTQIYVDDVAESQADKAKRSGFVVTGRSATKDGAADYLTIDGKGTTVYVEDDSSKAKRSGFVVTGRSATKDGLEPQYFAAGADGTTVYVDDTSADKAKRSGFVVTGRTATKGGDADGYLAVDGSGTQVYVDGADAEDKARRSGFVVTGRSASKAEEDTLFAIAGGYTRVYVDEDEAGKAKRSGFVVTGRTASKDNTDLFNVSGGGSVEITTNEFAVNDGADDTQETDTSAVEPQPGDTASTPEPVVQKPKSLFTVSSGNVQVGTEMVMMGEVAKKIEADTISVDTVEAEMPVIARIVDRADTVSCAAYKPFIYGGESDSEGYALLGIYSKGTLAKVTATDTRRNTVLLIDADGNVTKRQKYATVAVLMPEGDTQIYIRPLKATSQTISFGLMRKNATEPYQYIKVEAEIEATAGVPYKIGTSSNYGGRIAIDGTVAYGDQPTFEPVPMTGYKFVRWSDGSTRAKRTFTILDDFEISAEFERMSYVVAVKSDDERYGTVTGSGSGTYWHGDTLSVKAEPATGYYFSNWSGAELGDSQQSSSLALEVTSKLKLIAHFGVKQYTITFDTDGGSEIEPAVVYYQARVTAPAEPQREGYRFLDWEPRLPKEMPAEDLTVKATWSVKQYLITFDTDGGTPVDIIDANYGETVTAPADPEREGYTFAGWSDSIPATMPARDLKLTALWTVNSYELTWSANGGRFADGDTVAVDTVDYGAEVAAPSTAPNRTGYTFAGWKLDGTDEVPAMMPAKATTCTAQWTVNKHTIIYMVEDTVYAKVDSVAYGTDIEPVTIAEKPGYTFSGWKLNGKDELPQTMPDSNVVLTGLWTANDIVYTVEHWQEGLDGKYVIVKTLTDTLTGKAGAQTDAKAKAMTGFEAQTFSNEVIGTANYRTSVTIRYKRQSYQLTWNANGGTIDGKSERIDSLLFGAPIVAPTVVREGYECSGWGGLNVETMPASDLSVVALWGAGEVTYTVEHKGEGTDGGYIALASQTLTGVTGSQTEATAKEFTGFAAPESIDQQTIAADGTTTVSIIYKRNSYRLIWDANGGTINGKAADTLPVGYGVAISRPAEPSQKGYTFLGWEPEVPATMPTKDTAFHAKWDTLTYTISFKDTAGSTFAMANPIEYTVNDEIVIQNPEKAGYTFLGWTGGKWETATQNIVIKNDVGDFELKANWSANVVGYTVRHNFEDLQGGYSIVESEPSSGATDDWTAAAAMTRTGFTLRESIVQQRIKADESTIIDIYYIRDSYTLTWKDGDETIDSEDIKFEATVTMHSSLTRDGYNFLGWSDTLATMPAAHTTLTAKWDTIDYTITYDLDGGTVATANAEGYTVVSEAITLNTPTRTGYTFAGWTGTGLTEATMEVTIAKGSTGNRTYKAVWAINQYTIAVTAANGTVSGTGDYEYGQTVELTATADAHYHFVNWNGKNELTNPTISFTATKDSSLTANFAIDQFTVNFGPATDGTGTVTVKVNGNNITSGSKVNYGTEVTLTTTPESGYYFIRWSDGETGNTRTITKDTTINAVFKKEILVGDSLVYTLTSATTVSVGKGSTKPKGVLEIPATVTDADGDSFSITKIGNYAFEDCSGLTSVTLPNGITSISFSAFRRCTGLTSVTIPESVKSLGQEAFCGTGLSSVTIPASATSIGVAAFSQCTQLAVITVAEGNTKYIDIDGVLYTIDTTELVQFPIGKTDTMYIVHNKVKTIGAYAFYYNKLKHVAIPSGVTKIGSYPFGVCYNLKSVTLPSSCTTVESNVFLSCSNLTIYCQAEDAPSNTNGAKAVKLNCKAIKIALDTTNGKGTAKILTEGGYGADGSTWIAYGEPIDLQATPKGESYELDKFTVNGEEIDNPYTVTDDATITAVFKMKSLRVTATANNAAMGTVTGGGSFEYGGNATLTATPATGHEFVRWSDGSTLNPREFSNLTADTEIEAIFAPIKYTITFVGETGETLATSEVDYGTMPEYTGSAPTKASTAQYTYTFDGWNPELAIVTGNQTYTVVFTPELRKYTVNFGPANGEGGTVTATANGSTIASGSKVDYGTELTLTAEESANGYYFFRWSDGETATPYTLTIVKDSTIGAVYKKEFIAANGLKYTLTSKTTVSVGKGSTAPVGELDIPATVTDADGDSFNVTSMAENAFKESSELTSVTIPEGITSISENAFYGCTGLTSVTISSGVTNINKYAFYSCMALTSVDIPNSVTSIGEGAFNSCRSLTTVDIPNSVTSIGHGVFYGCSGLTSVSISNSVTSISSSMLERCPRLKSVIIPNGVTSIGSSAFYGCDSLESITIPESVTRIDKNAFEGCYGLTSVDIPKGVTIISEQVFYCCRSLTSVNIPEGVTSIGNYAFGRCSKLESVSIPEGVTSIGDAAFIYCSSLTSVSIPESVTSIIKQAFQGCSKLTSVTLPSTCTTVGTNAFSDCSNLTIYCQAETAPENVPSEQAKLNCKAIKIELDTTNGKGTAKILTVGGIAADSSRWFAAGDAIELQATPKSEMYELDKYTVDGAEVTSPYTVTADATITAVFKKKSLTVNFDAKGGTGTFEPQTVEYGLTATEPSTAPTREGYTFGGWYGDEDYNYSFDFDGAITSDTTIYAKWKQNYATVGGELYFDLQSTISAISEVSEDVTIELYSAVKAGDLGNIDEPNTIIYTIAYIQSQIGVTLVVPEGANIELEGDCSGLFQGLMRLVSADLRGLNTVGVTDMNSMFFNCKKLESLDVSGFNTEKVTDMNQMFYGCEALTTLDLSSFNTGNVTSMAGMFYGCSKLTELDVSGFNTEKVTDMDGMFWACSALTTIYAASGADWSGVYSSDDMFGCENLKGGNDTEWSNDYTDATYARIDKSGQDGYFTDINSVYGSVNGVYYNDLADLYNAIDTATGNAKVVLTGKVTASDLSGSGPNKVISAIMSSSASSISLVIPATAGIELEGDCSGLFKNCSKLVSADLRGLKTANVTNMSMMFRNCANLKTLDLSSFNTASVSNMGGMFYGCANLETLDLSGFNTEKVTDMSSMFLQCPALTTINVAPGADWYKEGVTSTDMFKYCTNLAGGSGTTFDENNIDATRARIDGGESAPGYFTCKLLSYYVNPATGNDSNTGLSAESALQSLAAALGKMNDRATYYNIFVSGKLTGAQGLGDTLNTRAKSITLTGLNGWSEGVPQDTFDGGFTTNTENGRPLTISTTVPVTVRYLALVGGYNSTNGGGLYAAENSRVTLDSSYVAGNKTKVQGAGIYLAEGSVVTMSSTVISENEIFSRVNGTETTKTCGGGVYIDRNATFNMKSGSIVRNISTDGGGGVFARGTFNMLDGTISTNYFKYSGTYVTNIDVSPPGTVNMYGGTITIDDDNTYGIKDGVVIVYAGSRDEGAATFNMHGGSITNTNSTSNDVSTSVNKSVVLVLNDNNSATNGCSCDFNMTGGEITGNQRRAVYVGAKYAGTATATLTGGTISGNVDIKNGEGNGVYADANSNLILSDSIKFGANDNIYLYNSKVLLLNTLTAEAPVATITPRSYSTSTQVLDLADGATTTIGDECGKFAMANTSWCVKSNGYLAEAVGVTFNLNGGTGTIASQIVVKGETAIKPATAPTRSGYAFAGWFTSAACTEAFSFAGAITKDTTLYAKWKQGVAETVDGKEYAKFSITTPEEYIALFNEIDTNYHTGDIYVSIENDLTLENVGYNLKDGFKGLIDGHGHTITLKSVKSSMYFSLFGFTNKGIIQNVKAQLDASFGDMIVTRESGAICQWFLGMLTTNGKGGILRNCWNDMSADAEVMNASGGICNKNEGLIENCINTGNLYCVINLNWGGRFGRVGGIAGDNDGGAIIRNTVNWGTVKLKTTTNWGDNILGLPGAICGGSYEGSLIENTYWRDSCIWANIDEYEDPAPTNYMIYNSSYQRGGTVTGCGHFTEDGTIIAGTAEMCGSEQTLGYGNSLLDALNSYVEGQNNPALKQWKVVDGKVVLDLEEN